MTSYTLDEPCADAVLEAMADGRERTLNDIARRVPMCAERVRRTVYHLAWSKDLARAEVSTVQVYRLPTPSFNRRPRP